MHLCIIFFQAYNDTIRVYAAKLYEFGIPPEELGFQLLETVTSNMPAGLVSSWKNQTKIFKISKRPSHSDIWICLEFGFTQIKVEQLHEQINIK